MLVRLETEGGLLLQILDQGYNRKAWHGPTLRHNIWELAVHAAYWKYTVRRRLLGEKRGSFVLKGSNWFPRPVDLSEAAWRLDLGILETEHRKLRAAIAGYLTTNKRHIPPKVLFGVAFHDIYHAGQIRLLRQLLKDQKVTSYSGVRSAVSRRQ